MNDWLGINRSLVLQASTRLALYVPWLIAPIICALIVPSWPWLTSLALIGTFVQSARIATLTLSWPRSRRQGIPLKLFGAYACVTLLAFAIVYRDSGLMHSSGTVSHSFIDACYFSIITFTTVGYGDFTVMPGLRFAASLEALLGLVTTAFGTSLIWLWSTDKIAKNAEYLNWLAQNEPRDFLEWYDKQYLTGGKAGPPPQEFMKKEKPS